MKINPIPRRENGITVRFLAQTIINSSIFPNNNGINAFLKCLKNHHHLNKERFSNLKYYFFLHLEDYGVNDKSEIDLILWNDQVILPVEIKAFTDANSPDVKKEIIRNYIHVQQLKNQSNFYFNPAQEIYPVLLYSKSYHSWKRKGNDSFNYFNDMFLLMKGKDQRFRMDNWGDGNYPLSEEYQILITKDGVLDEINRKLFFISWDDVYTIHQVLNTDEIFDKSINELRQLKDYFQCDSGIPLLSSK